VLDRVTEGPQLVVGSSMGGWIMLLAALQRPQRLAALVGIAAAPDFTESLWRDGLDDAQRASLERSGYCEIPNCYDDGQPYRIGRQLLQEGRAHRLLTGDIAIELPVRLLHGQLDEDVPWEHSLTIARHLRSDDVEVQWVKDGDHRLSRPRDLARLIRTVDALLGELGG
jgi:pimeloyl-ACP methyl ester carboxylesterase